MQLLPNGQTLATLYFGYSPNLILCYIGIAVFGVLFLLLSARIVLHSSGHKFLLLLPVTALAEMVGFVLRYLCAENPTIAMFIVMNILLLISANVLVMVNYKALAEVVVYSKVETRYYVIGPQLGSFFYKTNLVASILQSVGGGIQGDPDKATTGHQLAIAGSCLQLVFFIAFLFCVLYVWYCPDYEYTVGGGYPKKKIVGVILATQGILFVRLVYRVANFALGAKSIASTHEWSFYVFDCLLILLCFLINIVFFIGNYLPSINGNSVQDVESTYKTNSDSSAYPIQPTSSNDHSRDPPTYCPS